MVVLLVILAAEGGCGAVPAVGLGSSLGDSPVRASRLWRAGRLEELREGGSCFHLWYTPVQSQGQFLGIKFRSGGGASLAAGPRPVTLLFET